VWFEGALEEFHDGAVVVVGKMGEEEVECAVLSHSLI